MGADCSDPSAMAKRYLQQAFEDYDAGRFEAALHSCDRALHCIPSLPDAHNLRGVVLEELGRSEEAVDAYVMAIDLDPAFHEARQNLRELAVEWAERLSQDTPALEDGVGQHPDDRIFGQDPEAEMAKLHLAQAYKAYNAGRYDAAWSGCHLALALDSRLAEAHNLRGLALEELDRPGAAAEAYRHALDLDRNFAEARENWLELEAELAERRRPVTVAAFLHPLEAHIARGRLEEAGISSFLADEQMVTMNYFWSIGLHGVKLQVTEENAGEALEILLCEPDAGEYELREEDRQILCPQCRSYHTRYETYNLPLAYLASLLVILPIWETKVLLVVLLPAFLLLIPKRAWCCQSCGHTWEAARRPMA
jgi:Tfp pilus assembly protein PilF